MSEDELPEGWARTVLGYLTHVIQYGYTASAKKSGIGPRFLRITDIQNGHVDWQDVPTCEISGDDLTRFQLEPGDIVFARTGATTGKSFLIDSCPKAVFASYLIRLRALPAVVPRFLTLFFQTPSYWAFISDNSSGIAQPNCNASKLAALPVPVPPLAEQERIVAKVDELLARVNAAREHLARIPAILKRFRQAVLTAACEGRLTEANLEEWREATLEEVGKWFTGGTPSRRVATNFGGGIPWIKSGELRDGVVTETSETLSRTGVANSAAKLMPKGTVSVALYGATIGKVGVLGLEATTNQACANCVVNDRVIDRWFLFYFLTQQRDQLVEASQGGAQPNLTNQIVRAWRLRLPSIAEQREIVRRVEALFKLADAIEKRVAAATARAEKLTQAILAKAFRGELVQTEAELARREGRAYESAEVFLERSRATLFRAKAEGAPASSVQRRTHRAPSGRRRAARNRP